MKTKSLIFICVMVFSFLLSCGGSPMWFEKSPNGEIVVKVEQLETGALVYSITNQGKTVLIDSPLGLEMADESFSSQLTYYGTTGNKIDETYTLVHGKHKECHAEGNEMILSFSNENGSKVNINFRVFNDGVGLRYEFPGESAEPKTITSEKTGFQIPENSTAYMMPYDDPGQWWPAYENYYDEYPVGTESSKDAGWAFPALFKINDGENWLLLTESGSDGNYCGTRLEKVVKNNLYKIRFPEEKDGEGMGTVEPSGTLPWNTSWKVMLVGDELSDIVESDVITHLASPSIVDDTEWIKPGRASWSWWSESDSPRDLKTLKKFVDLAAEMGWEYSLVDANWNKEPESMIKKLVKYADQKNVKILLWYNSGGPNNVVTEEPRDRLYDSEKRIKEFKWMNKMGIAGIKVDFWHSDKQQYLQYYVDMLKDAAEHKILVNFHGCTIPRGWERTYPNMLTLESVRGAESYKFDEKYPEMAPWHNVLLAFTRGVIGPIDYTPVTFSDVTYPHITTNAHELALSIVFETGWLHFADRVESYRNLPDAPKEFLKNVPVVWDETKFLAGHPKDFVVLARKSGNVWYVAGINGQNNNQKVDIDLNQLLENVNTVELIKDGAGPREFAAETVSGDQPVSVDMAPLGGFVMTVK